MEQWVAWKHQGPIEADQVVDLKEMVCSGTANEECWSPFTGSELPSLSSIIVIMICNISQKNPNNLFLGGGWRAHKIQGDEIESEQKRPLIRKCGAGPLFTECSFYCSPHRPSQLSSLDMDRKCLGCLMKGWTVSCWKGRIFYTNYRDTHTHTPHYFKAYSLPLCRWHHET